MRHPFLFFAERLIFGFSVLTKLDIARSFYLYGCVNAF
jgi:hypothetical protein